MYISTASTRRRGRTDEGAAAEERGVEAHALLVGEGDDPDVRAAALAGQELPHQPPDIHEAARLCTQHAAK